MDMPNYDKYFKIENIIKSIEKYLPGFDVKKFRKAFSFAEEAHRGQFRKDGKTPYLVHPVCVVEMLASMGADEDILICAMLHDVPEDTPHEISEIKQLFGEKIAFLVDGITKLSKVQYRHDMPSRQVESLKKLFLHSSQDPRVILIKLADRLHNMRTLEHVRPEKQLRIATETLEIYVPIANLLGVQGLKTELEDLCFQYIFPNEYNILRRIVDGQNKKHTKAVEVLCIELTKALNNEGIKPDVHERKRSIYSIYKKLSSSGRAIESVEDRIALRIIVNKTSECYETLGIIHGKYTPKTSRFKDYIANPKNNTYQSLHTTVFGPKGKLTEIQIRTKEMHLQAEYGIAADCLKNNGKITKDRKSWWVNKIIEIEKMNIGNGNFLESLKSDVLEDRIVVYTPNGRSIDLPKGSSAIDFAFAIHTEVGNSALKAEINGDLHSVTTILNKGDTVNIIQSDKTCPQLSWLSFVRTNFARDKIRDCLKKMSTQAKIKAGMKILQKQLDVAGMGLLENLNYRKLLHSLNKIFDKNYRKLNDLLIDIGEGNINALDVIKSAKKKHNKIIKVSMKVVAKNRFGLLKDISDVLYKYSMDMTFLKGWSSHNDVDAFFTAEILVENIDDIGNIVAELEQVDDVIYAYRVSNKGVFATYAFAFFTVLVWIFHPYVIRKIDVLQQSDQTNMGYVYAVNLGLLILLSMLLYLTHLTKKYFPMMRNKNLIWIISFSIPAFSLFALLMELFYFDLRLSWGTVIMEIAIVYIYLGVSFRNFRKNS